MYNNVNETFKIYQGFKSFSDKPSADKHSKISIDWIHHIDVSLKMQNQLLWRFAIPSHKSQ